MDKLAQERDIFNKLREKANITGKILESINPEFQEMMDKLRATDEKIRSHAENIKDIVRAAKSHNNRRDYLSSATNIASFHERCRFISAELQKFIKGVNLKHYKFLLDQFDDEQKQKLFGYDPDKEISLEEESAAVDDRVITAALKKQAGLSDWWFGMTDPIGDLAHNLSNSRGVAMRALEKRFSIAFLKELKANTGMMVVRTQRFLSQLVATFKILASALAKRNVDQYVKAAKSFISKFAEYHKSFAKYYKDNIIPLKERHSELVQESQAKKDEAARRMEEEKSKKMEDDAARTRQEAPSSAPGSAPFPAARPYQYTPPGTPGHIPMVAVPGVKKEKKMYEPEHIAELLSEEPFDLTKKKSSDEFIAKIEKFASTNDPKSFMLEVLAYSEKLEETDPETSLKLLAIAEGIAEDYKTAGVFDFFNKKDEQKEKEESRPLV